MIEANTATYGHQATTTGMIVNTGEAGSGSPKPSPDCAHNPLDSARPADVPLFPNPPAETQVREDKGSYIPDFLSFEDDESDPERRAAAAKHASDLRRAERYLDEVFNLVGVLKASLGDDGDDRAVQAETVLSVIEKKLNKAHTRLDKHDTRYTELFLAYYELSEKSEKAED